MRTTERRIGRRVAVGAAFLAAAALAGCKASAPGKTKTAMMNVAKRWLFIGGRKDRNPMAANAQSIADGKEAFGHYCIVCHGLDGQNTGVPFAAQMDPPVPSLASPAVQRYTDGQLKWVIENGVAPSGMPAARGILSDDEQWSIVIYLRHLPPAGSLGEPGVYGN
ncbi:MAG TPA: c-type cytochrome [Acidobacteriaceae bacterium]|nr:c-type cytochrome [Acidobacteriaceae bacterium]